MSFSRHPFCLFIVAWLLWGSAAADGARAAESGRPSIRMGSVDGVRRYRPGMWSVVAVEAVNPTDEATELFAAVYFTGTPTLQYGRKVWVPGNSRLRTTCPIRVPDSSAHGESHVSLVSVPVDPADGADVLGGSHVEAVAKSRPLILTDEPLAVVILGEFDSSLAVGRELPFHTGLEVAPEAPDDPIYEVVLAGKLDQGLSRRMSSLNAWKLPADSACLDAVDIVVLCSDRPASDPDATTLIRDWVLRGGHLWIMLDEMESDSVSAILGDAFTSVVVDRVKLTELEIEDVRVDVPPEESTILEFEDPVSFVRVVPGDVTVTDRVDDWPAAFWQPFGAGRVFFTTLGAQAWCRPATPDDPRPQGSPRTAFSVPRGPLRRLAEQCFSVHRAEPVDVAAVKPFLAKQIGYRILSREVVAAVLATFCVVLGVAGTWFWRIGRLDRLLWVGPLAAAGTSLVFLGVAVTARTSVPATVAIWQRVTFEPGVATGRACGLASLYNPDTCDSEMGAERGGIFVPDMTAMGGQRRRMMWTDEGVWYWGGLELPPGERTAPFEHILSLEETVDCRASFGPSGLTGVFGPAPFQGLSDAVIALPNQPLLATKIHADGSFSSGVSHVLASDEFVAGTFLSDVQQGRVDVYRLLLERRSEGNLDTRPMLYVWADPVDGGLVFPQANRLGSALISVPVQVEVSREGTEVTVPAPFIPYRGVVGPDGSRPTAYGQYRHEWMELKTAANEWLQFQLPEAILPFELTRAEISLDIRAPSRSVEILGLKAGSSVVVKSLSYPIGTYQVVLDQPELLQLDDDGGLRIGIRVGSEETEDPTDLMTQASWKIESLQMNVVGKVLGE